MLTMENVGVRDQRQRLRKFDLGVRATVAALGTNSPEPETECVVLRLVNVLGIEERGQS